MNEWDSYFFFEIRKRSPRFVEVLKSEKQDCNI